jgi:hypothetical protein
MTLIKGRGSTAVGGYSVVPIAVDDNGYLIFSSTTVGGVKPADDAASGGPYYIRSDTSGIIFNKPCDDGTGPFYILSDSAGSPLCKVVDDGASGGPYYMLSDTSGQLLVANDGSNALTIKSDASGQVYVLQGALLPGEDSGNDWRKTKKEEIATYSPAKTAGTAVAGAYDIVLASVEVLSYPNFTVSFLNVEGGTGDVLDSFRLQASPDNTNWGDIAETTGLAWAAANGVYMFSVNNNSYRYVRAHAACAAGDTTADCWITANKG